MILYGLKNCDRCREALQCLESEGFEVMFRNIRTENLTVATIADWWNVLGAGMLNRRSTTWRSLSEAERCHDPVALMQRYAALIKRPVLVTAHNAVSCGWSPAHLDWVKGHS